LRDPWARRTTYATRGGNQQFAAEPLERVEDRRVLRAPNRQEVQRSDQLLRTPQVRVHHKLRGQKEAC